MDVLIYGNRKSNTEMYDISTPEKEAAAYLLIFNMLDTDWGVYADLKIQKVKREEIWKRWYDEAKAGNAQSAKKLLRARSREQYEYEILQEGEVIDPLAVKVETEV